MLRRSIRGFEAEANSSEADEYSLENGSIGLTEITPNSNSPQVEAPVSFSKSINCNSHAETNCLTVRLVSILVPFVFAIC